MAALIPGTHLTDAHLRGVLPGTTEQVRRRLLGTLPEGEGRADLSLKLTANVVVALLKARKRDLGIKEGRVLLPCATVTQQRRHPKGQLARYWSLDSGNQ